MYHIYLSRNNQEIQSLDMMIAMYVVYDITCFQLMNEAITFVKR